MRRISLSWSTREEKQDSIRTYPKHMLPISIRDSSIVQSRSVDILTHAVLVNTQLRAVGVVFSCPSTHQKTPTEQTFGLRRVASRCRTGSKLSNIFTSCIGPQFAAKPSKRTAHSQVKLADFTKLVVSLSTYTVITPRTYHGRGSSKTSSPLIMTSGKTRVDNNTNNALDTLMPTVLGTE